MFTTTGFAFELDLPVDIPGVSKKNKSESEAEDGGISSQETKAMLLSFWNSINFCFAEALDLKEVAQVAKQNSENLSKGDLAGKDDLKKVVSSSNDVQAKINKKMAENKALSAEGKVKFATGISPYVKGTIDVVATGKNAQSATKSLSSTRDLTILSKMATLIYVGKESPSMIKLFLDSTSTLSKFMSSNKLDTKELESASDALGE